MVALDEKMVGGLLAPAAAGDEVEVLGGAVSAAPQELERKCLPDEHVLARIEHADLARTPLVDYAGSGQVRMGHHLSDSMFERQLRVNAEVDAHLHEGKRVQEEEDGYMRIKSEEMFHLHNALTAARNDRLERGRKMAEGVSARLEEVREAIGAEQRIRKESESTLLELFGQMGQKLDQELEQARAERRDGTDRVVAAVAAANANIQSKANLSASFKSQDDAVQGSKDRLQEARSRINAAREAGAHTRTCRKEAASEAKRVWEELEKREDVQQQMLKDVYNAFDRAPTSKEH